MRIRTAGYGIFQQKRSGRPFIIKVNYASGFTVTLPLSGTCNFIVDWGDGAVGQITSPTDVDRIHTYASGGTYTITMTGTLQKFYGSTAGMYEYIISVEQWGRTGFTDIYMGNAGTTSCKRLVYTKGKLITSQTSFAYMFLGCSALTSCDVSEWDVSAITDFGLANWSSGMFSGCTALTSLDCSNWVFSTSSPVRFSAVFSGCSNLTTIGSTSAWNTSKFYSISAAFSGCAKLTTSSIDVSAWDTSNITDFGFAPGYGKGAFAGCSGLTSIDVRNWNVTKGTQFGDLFYGCIGLTTLDVSNWVFNSTSNFTADGVFYGCTNITTLDVSNWNMNKCTSAHSIFYNCQKLESIDVSAWDTSNITTLMATFANCYKLTAIDVSSWNVTKCTQFGYVWGAGTFENCIKLTSLDLSGWVINTTSNVSMGRLVKNCTVLTTVGTISGWNMSKVTYLNSMFNYCPALTSITLTNWNVSACTDFQNMFFGCTNAATIDVSGWTLNTTAASVLMQNMFFGCTALTSLDVTSWNTSKVTNTAYMFQGCNNTSFTSITGISGWDMSANTNMSNMFYGCSKLTTLTISGWTLNSSANINMTSIFQNCAALTSIDITSWNMTKVTNTTGMFSGCYGLTSLTLPASLSRVDNQFAVFGGSPPAITVYNINRSAAPIVSGTPFGNYAKPLHVPVSNSGYNVAPWTNTAIFSSIINDL